MNTILLIEDHTEILDNLKEYLELAGFKILTATSGEEGVAMTKEYRPHVIVCDVLMPGINGYEVLKQLKEIKHFPFLFIFSSSLSEKVDKLEALKLGADDYFVKPF